MRKFLFINERSEMPEDRKITNIDNGFYRSKKSSSLFRAVQKNLRSTENKVNKNQTFLKQQNG